MDTTIARSGDLIALLLLSGCAGMMTGSSPYGGGSFGGSSSWREPTSEYTYVPLNFSLRANKGYDLRKHLSELTEERQREFISIDIREISFKYGFAGDAWSMEFEKSSIPNPSPVPDLFYSAFPTIVITCSIGLSYFGSTIDENCIAAIKILGFLSIFGLSPVATYLRRQNANRIPI